MLGVAAPLFVFSEIAKMLLRPPMRDQARG
jgi:hypothetical protein